VTLTLGAPRSELRSDRGAIVARPEGNGAANR
jgi:hypothetical protein